MNFLWIEDSERIDDLKNKFFDEKLFDDIKHKLFTPKNFEIAYQEICKARKKYDYIILDINLENFDIGKTGKKLYKNFENEIDEAEFMKEAGFHLYIQLLAKGFDKDRVIFLTGNTKEKPLSSLLWQFEQAIENNEEKFAEEVIDLIRTYLSDSEYENLTDLINDGDIEKALSYWNNLISKYEISEEAENTYDIFNRRFLQARIPIPFSIHKNEVKDFHTWVKGKTEINQKNDNDYILLRRALIDSYDEISKLIGKKIDIIFNKAIKRGSQAVFYVEIKTILRNLKDSFSLSKKDYKEITEKYYSFLRELSAFWERNNGYVKRKDINVNNLEYNFVNFCQNEMKLLRNWTAHEQISKNISAKEVAFFYIIAIRGLLELDMKKLYDYEIRLLKLFNNTEVDKIVEKLSISYYDLRKLYKKYTNPYQNDFNYLLKDVYHQSGYDKNNSIKYFYQNFWHAIFPCSMYISKAKNNNVQIELKFKVNENYKNYPILDSLAKATYSEAFGE